MMFYIVIWTLEKRCRWGNLGCHVCVAGVNMVRGSCAWKSSSKAWELASEWGEGWRNRNHSTKRNSRKFCFLIVTPGKTQQPAAEGPFVKHKRHGSTWGMVLPCLSNAPQVCYGFYSYNYSGSKTTSRDCKSAARINVFPVLRKKTKQNKTKTQTVLIFDMCTGLLNE